MLQDRRNDLLRGSSFGGLVGLLGLLALLVGLLVGLGVGLLVGRVSGLGRLVGADAEGDEDKRGESSGDRADHLGTPEFCGRAYPGSAIQGYSKARAVQNGAFFP